MHLEQTSCGAGRPERYMRLMRFLPLVVIALALVAACGSDGVGGGEGDASVPSVDAPASVKDAGSGGDVVVPSAPDAARPTKFVYVAGGQDLRHLVSFDNATFTNDTYIAPSGFDNAFSVITIGNGRIVAVADAGIFTSDDAITWTQHPKPQGVDNLHGTTGVFGDGRFVFVSQAFSFTSPDGLTWTTHTESSQYSAHWHGMAYGNGHYVGIGDSCRKVSEDGLIWHDFAPTPVNLHAIAYGAGKFVVTASGAADPAGYTSTSTDGVAWTAPVATATTYTTGFTGIAYGAGHFVTSDCCNAFVSPDGVTWTKKQEGLYGGSLSFSGAEFVSVGWRTSIRVSKDGEKFTGVFSDDGPNKFDASTQAPFLTASGSGWIYR